MTALREKAKTDIMAILSRYPAKRSAVLPLCQLAQKHYGYMSSEAVREVAELLEMDPTEVRGLVDFYTLLREQPVGRHVIEICNDLPCALHGADALIEHVCRRLDVRPGETTSDGLFSVETVMCIAACDRAPVAQIDLEYYEDLDPGKIDEILERLESGKESKEDESGSDSGTRA